MINIQSRFTKSGIATNQPIMNQEYSKGNKFIRFP